MDEGDMVEACTFVHRHPLLLCSIFFLAFLYAFFYPVFAFLLASSPVLVLAAFLLGVVLLHSVPQDAHDHHHVYKKIQSRPPQSHHITTTLTAPGTHHHHRHQQRPSRGSPSTSSSSDSDGNPPAATSTATSLASFPNAAIAGSDSDSESEPEHGQRKNIAWTADDMKSIENIGSLELERNAAVEKLMSERLASPRTPPQHRRRAHQHVATRKSNPFDLDDDDDDFPGSAPSMLLHHASRSNPFFDDDDDDDDLLPLHAPQQPQQNQSLSSASSPPGARAAAQQQKKNAMLFRRHESFTMGAPHASDFRPSRFRPYFVIDKMQGQPVAVPEAGGSGKSSPSSSSSSSSSFSAGANAYASVSANNKEEDEAAEQEEALAEAEAAAMLETKTDDHHDLVRPREVVAVDVELISDSSDDDISLPEPMKVHQQQQQKPPLPPPQQQQVVVSDQDDDDEGESFEVESITKQVAAAAAEGKGKQADPSYDYSLTAGTVEKQQQEQASDQLPPLAPPSMAQIKLASMRRVFSEEDADEPWAAPSGLEETTTTEKEAREQDMFPLPPLPESAPAAGAAPPLSVAAKKAVGKSSKYKPPSKKAVLGFFQGKGKA